MKKVEKAIKNQVITESAYEIDMEKIETGVISACPRCGHKQERKTRGVCESCKRFIPAGSSKQKWAPEKKVLYADMEQYFPKEDEVVASECKFVKSRRTFSYLRLIRDLAVIGVLCAGVYYAGPTVLKSTIGEAAYSKIDGEVHQTIAKLAAQGKKLASTAKKK